MKFQVVLSTGRIFEAIFYLSVTRYSLSIEKRFLGNKCVSITNDTSFAWYSKCGGGNAGLKFIFHIKDDKVCIFNPYLITLDLNTELAYDDGSATPFVPIYPLKEQKSSEASKTPLYRLVGSYCIISLSFLFSYEWCCICLCIPFRYCTLRHRWELPGNYPYFEKYCNLPLCLENYALFSLPLILHLFYIHIH